MTKVSDLLKAIINNPDDLTKLPQIIAQVETFEQQDFDYQKRIKDLQDINKSYLGQIPINDVTKAKTPEEEQNEVTLEDARQAVINAMGGN